MSTGEQHRDQRVLEIFIQREFSKICEDEDGNCVDCNSHEEQVEDGGRAKDCDLAAESSADDLHEEEEIRKDSRSLGMSFLSSVVIGEKEKSRRD